MKEYLLPRPHQRFRLQGDAKHPGRHIDLAVVPEGEIFCLHVFLEGAEATKTLLARVNERETKLPAHICAICAVVVGADKPEPGRN